MPSGSVISSERLPELSFYEEWVAHEGLPVIKDYYLPDIRTVEIFPWPRKGGKGLFLNLIGTEDSNDAYICEIPPGGKLEPQRHLYEEMIYVLAGRGATSVWLENGQKQTFEWQAGSLFAIPLNFSYQHFNGSGKEPARYFAVTDAPLVMNLFHNEDFIFRNPFVFSDRYQPRPDYWSSEGIKYTERLRGCNFISDVRTFTLVNSLARGAGASIMCFEMTDNTMASHIAEFPVGTYKKAHRHGPGAHVVIIAGKGYSLMWLEGEEKRKFDWHEGSVIVPPNLWFHQHFNSGAKPARYLALRWNSQKHKMGRQFRLDEDVKKGGDQIEYEDEDSEVRKLFEEELAKEGVESKMARFFGGRSGE